MPRELKRRLVHASGTVVPLLYVAGLVPWRYVQGLLVAGSALAAVLETLRLSGHLHWGVYEMFTREYEEDNVGGYALGVFGATAVAVSFEPRVAVPAILMLTVADPISGLLGSGSLAKQGYVLAVTFAVCVFIASWFVPPLVAGVGAVVATLADGLKPVVAGYVLDDNLTIPVGAGVAMWAALRVVTDTAVAV